MLNVRGIIELFAREYVAEHGGSITPSPLNVMATGHDAAGSQALNANSLTTFPPVVPCTDDPWLWLGVTAMGIATQSPTELSLRFPVQAGIRFTLQRTRYRPGNVACSSVTGVEFDEGWIPTDILAARSGTPFLWCWPMLLQPTDSIFVEVCDQANASRTMVPVTLVGYRLERGPA